MQASTLSEIYGKYLNRPPFRECETDLYALCPEAGAGLIRRCTTFGGIEIVHSQIRYHDPYRSSFSARGQLIELQFALSGQRYVTIDRQEYTLPVGKGALVLLQDFRASFHPPSDQPYDSFALGIPVPLFHYALSSLGIRSSADLPRLLAGNSFWSMDFELDAVCMAQVQRLIAELRHPLRSALRLEAAALELLDRSLQRLFDPSPAPEGFSREDVRRLHEARRIVETSSEHPPSLLQLSRLVGINDFKLKKGFKACFGTTVFEHVRATRLERAMALLREGSSVTEAAMSVGYSNASAFAQQFFRRYAVKPSSVGRRR
ncbi:AraC family transcriptional regulator [Saccharibacillus sacchari]|uniref:AraC family transcriptional regulator n=1 Tax=Saccharibacillus sacchari TaxID=456493 RepID=A0ACC6P8X1_9BACL